MKSAREVSGDGKVPEARVFERLNVNLESASDVKSQPFDRDTCAQIKEGTGKCYFETLCTPCHMKPHRSAGRGLSLFAEQVNSLRLGGLGTDHSDGGPRRMGGWEDGPVSQEARE